MLIAHDDTKAAPTWRRRYAPNALGSRFYLVCGLVTVSLSAASGCRHAAAGNEKKDKGPDVRVRVQPAAERTLAEKVTGLGRCEAEPGHFAALTAATEGRVVGLLKRPGDKVQAGDAIVQLDTTVAQNSLIEKQRAAESQKLAVDQADMALQKAQYAFDRVKPLRKGNLIPEPALYDAEMAQRQAELQLKVAKVQYQMADAAVATAKSQIAQLTIRTPISGVLNGLTCQLGQTLSVGAAIGEVVDAGRIQAVLWMTVADARQVKPQQAANVRPCGSSFDEPASSDESGSVLDVGKVTDPQTGNLPIRVTVKNADGRLTLGEAVLATIIVREEKSLAVPAKAVRDNGDETVLVIVRGGETAVLHPKLGLKDDGWVAVSDTDLKPGEPVVTEGGYALEKGVKVEAEKDEAAKKDEPEKKNDDEKRDDQKKDEGGKKETNNRLKPELQQAGSDR